MAIKDWNAYRKLALGLKLPNVVEATSWGNPCLKAHGKLWAWWSPSANAPIFKMPKEERDFLIEVDPDTFFTTDHYRSHNLILAKPDLVDPDWACNHLKRTWREMTPKRFLKEYDGG